MGDRIDVVFDDAPNERFSVVVSGFESDTEQGFSPEIEDYVAGWGNTDLKVDSGQTLRRSVVLGPDAR